MLIVVNPYATTVSDRLKNLVVYALQGRFEVEAVSTEAQNHATEIGLEGIVSKRKDAQYIEARSKTWVKVKAPLAGDFPIVGYTLSTAAAGIGAIALGQWVNGELEYAGKCGTGFSGSELLSIHDKLAPLGDPSQKLEGMPRDVIVRNGRINWVIDAAIYGALAWKFWPRESPATR